MSAALCPQCKKPTDPLFRPFCSKRCADLDLQRWLTGRYVIAASDDDEEDSAPAGEVDDEA
jgi:endogenous inhibitor of DNA gyrase (YacG/DUF329 family)